MRTNLPDAVKMRVTMGSPLSGQMRASTTCPELRTRTFLSSAAPGDVRTSGFTASTATRAVSVVPPTYATTVLRPSSSPSVSVTVTRPEKFVVPVTAESHPPPALTVNVTVRLGTAPPHASVTMAVSVTGVPTFAFAAEAESVKPVAVPVIETAFEVTVLDDKIRPVLNSTPAALTVSAATPHGAVVVCVHVTDCEPPAVSMNPGPGVGAPGAPSPATPTTVRENEVTVRSRSPSLRSTIVATTVAPAPGLPGASVRPLATRRAGRTIQNGRTSPRINATGPPHDDPVTLKVKVDTPAPDAENVQLNVWDAADGRAMGPGGEGPDIRVVMPGSIVHAAAETPAASPPMLVTVKVTVTNWPSIATTGDTAGCIQILAGTVRSVVGVVNGAVRTGPPKAASVPATVAVNRIAPTPVVAYCQVK